MSTIFNTPGWVLIVVGITFAILGVILIVKARRRRVGSVSCCRNCEYELASEAEQICPECGATVSARNLRVGKRSPSAIYLIAGICLVLASLVPAMPLALRLSGGNYYRHLPIGVVIASAEGGSVAAVVDLEERVRAGGGKPHADRLLDLCVDRVQYLWPDDVSSPPASVAPWGRLFHALYDRGTLSDAEIDRFFDVALRAELDLRIRYRVGESITPTIRVYWAVPSASIPYSPSGTGATATVSNLYATLDLVSLWFDNEAVLFFDYDYSIEGPGGVSARSGYWRGMGGATIDERHTEASGGYGDLRIGVKIALGVATSSTAPPGLSAADVYGANRFVSKTIEIVDRNADLPSRMLDDRVAASNMFRELVVRRTPVGLSFTFPAPSAGRVGHIIEIAGNDAVFFSQAEAVGSDNETDPECSIFLHHPVGPNSSLGEVDAWIRPNSASHQSLQEPDILNYGCLIEGIDLSVTPVSQWSIRLTPQRIVLLDSGGNDLETLYAADEVPTGHSAEEQTGDAAREERD